MLLGKNIRWEGRGRGRYEEEREERQDKPTQFRRQAWPHGRDVRRAGRSVAHLTNDVRVYIIHVYLTTNIIVIGQDNRKRRCSHIRFEVDCLIVWQCGQLCSHRRLRCSHCHCPLRVQSDCSRAFVFLISLIRSQHS